MAVTALWAVHGTHRDILDYVMNPEKTENPDYSLCKVLNYAENDEKTEKKYFVTGINCTPDFAYEPEGWKKPVRLDYLGERYSMSAIEERLQRSFYKPQAFPAVPRTRPIECLKRDISNFYERSSIELIFMILFELMGISYYDVYENREYEPLQYRALSPCFRCEAIRNEQYSRECRMMGKYGLHTEDDVKQFAAEREQELSRLSAERQKIDNARRRVTDPQEKQKNSEARHAITQKMIIVRREKNLADDILLDYAVAARLVGIEMKCEKRLIPDKEQTQNKTKNRKDYER